jgi:hypothetical protein
VGREGNVHVRGLQVAVRRQFEGEVFLMEDWIGNRTAIRHAMGRLLNLVCGDGECKDPRVVKVTPPRHRPSGFVYDLGR